MKNICISTVLTVLASLAIIFAAGCATGGGLPAGVPLPPDINIVQPEPGLAKNLAGLSGAWGGAWDNQIDFVIIVEEIKAGGALVIYARSGTNAGWWRRFAYVDEGTLRLEIREADITMKFTPANGWLKGEYFSRRGTSSATLGKIL